VLSQAVQRIKSGSIVEVVTGEGETKERMVEVGESNGIRTEIVSGLEEGEQVVVQVSGQVPAIPEGFKPPSWGDVPQWWRGR